MKHKLILFWILILLSFSCKNPIENIDNTKDIWSVIKNGNYLDRSELDSLLMN